MCRWRHKIRKIAVEILQSVNNRTQCLREIVYYAWLLLTYVVINSLLGGLTLDPAGMHRPAGDDGFVSSLELAGRSLSAGKVWGDRTTRAGCIGAKIGVFVCHA